MAWGYLAMPATPETEGCLAPTRASDGSLFFFTHGSKVYRYKAKTEAKILVSSKVKLNSKTKKKKPNKKKQRYAIMLLLHGGTLNMTLLYY